MGNELMVGFRIHLLNILLGFDTKHITEGCYKLIFRNMFTYGSRDARRNENIIYFFHSIIVNLFYAFLLATKYIETKDDAAKK